MGNIFFSDFFFLFPLLEPVQSALCSTASRSARSLFLFFIPYSCIKASVMSSLGNKTLPPDSLAVANIHRAQHILDVLLQVCARQRALAGFCFPGLPLLYVHSSSSEC